LESSETFQKFMRVLKAKTAISFHLQRFIIWIVARPGFEPRHTEPKSVVLPLYYRAIRPIHF
jgi:hypothetical protein